MELLFIYLFIYFTQLQEQGGVGGTSRGDCGVVCSPYPARLLFELQTWEPTQNLFPGSSCVSVLHFATLQYSQTTHALAIHPHCWQPYRHPNPAPEREEGMEVWVAGARVVEARA